MLFLLVFVGEVEKVEENVVMYENRVEENAKPYHEEKLMTKTLTLVPDVINGNMVYVTITTHKVPQSAKSSIFKSRFNSISEMLKESAEIIERCLDE